MLDRIARGLMLTEPEREHLHELKLGRPPEARSRPVNDISPRLQRVLDGVILHIVHSTERQDGDSVDPRPLRIVLRRSDVVELGVAADQIAGRLLGRHQVGMLAEQPTLELLAAQFP